MFLNEFVHKGKNKLVSKVVSKNMSSLMSLLIFRFGAVAVVTFLRNGLKLHKENHWKLYLIMEELEHKFGLRVAERIIIFENTLINLALHFKMVSVAYQVWFYL